MTKQQSLVLQRITMMPPPHVKCEVQHRLLLKGVSVSFVDDAKDGFGVYLQPKEGVTAERARKLYDSVLADCMTQFEDGTLVLSEEPVAPWS